MTSLPKYLVHGNNCNVGKDKVCCFRNPHVCRPGSLHNSSRPSVGLTEPRPLTTAQAQPLRLTAANSTYGCCERSDTFWREPVDDVPPYRRLVQRLLQPFGERISRADVLRATYSTEDGVYRTTCAILRVARGKVCKVRVLGQRLEKTSHKPQEAGLLSLVRKLLPLPDFELACALCTRLGSLPLTPPPPHPIRCSRAWAPGVVPHQTVPATARPSLQTRRRHRRDGTASRAARRASCTTTWRCGSSAARRRRTCPSSSGTDRTSTASSMAGTPPPRSCARAPPRRRGRAVGPSPSSAARSTRR